MNKDFWKKTKLSHALLFIAISVLLVVIYGFLIKHSQTDETMLYSWWWVVRYVSLDAFFFMLIVLLAVSFFISKIDLHIKEIYFLFAVFILAFLLSALTWGSAIPNPDVAEFFGVAKYIEVNGLWGYTTSFGAGELSMYRFHTFPFLVGLLFRYIGESVLLVNMFTSIMFSLIPVLTFLLAKRLFEEKTAMISSIFVLSMPLLLVQSSMFLVDMPTVFFVLLALLSFHCFLSGRKVLHYPFAGLAILLALVSKRTAVLFLLLSLFVMLLIVKKRSHKDLRYISMKSFVIFYLVFIVLISFLFFKLDFFSSQLGLDLSQANIIGNPPHYVNSFSYFFQIQPVILILFLVFLMFFALRPTLSKLFLFVWVFFPFLFIQGTTVRYMLPAFPAIAIGAALMLSKLKKPITVFVVSAIFLSSTLFFAMGYLPMLKGEFYDNNIRAAAKYTNGLDINTIGVYMEYANLTYKISPKTEIFGYVFDYYSDKRVFYDISESVADVYSGGFKRFKVFDYYKDEDYLSPNYDAVIVFSNTYDYQLIGYPDVKKLAMSLEDGYYLNKTFFMGKSGIEENRYAFVYLGK